MYNIHLDPYVGPQISKASVALSPYASTFTAKVYNPYLRPAMEAFLPAIVFAPEPPQNFWSMIADKLPIAGSNFAQNKGSLGDFYSDVHNAKRPADVPVPSAEKRVNSRGMDRAEMDRVREAIKERVEKQGQKGYEKVHDEVIDIRFENLGRSYLCDCGLM